MISSCIFWQIAVLQGLTNGNVTRSTNVNLSSLTNGNIPNMTDANLTKLFVRGCTRVIQNNRLRWRDAQIPRYGFSLDLRGKTIALTLHTGVLSNTFVIKSCKNPARHIFPWLPGEAVGLHPGVLTKMFAMSVLYLKTIDVFLKENRLISLYIKRGKRKFAQTISFIQSYCEFIFIWSRYSIKPKKKLFSAAAEAACRAVVVVVVLRDAVVEVFNAAWNLLHL